jgi:hypothetical protein
MKTSIITTALLIGVAFSACKKDKDEPAPLPPAAVQRIAIKLNTDYLTASNVDSALVIWNVNGQVEEKKMQLSNDTLFIATKDLTEGTGQLYLQVFSNVKLRQRNLQWEKGMATTVKHKESINVAAPVSYTDPDWFPRVILRDPPALLTAIVALRPEDPYFFMKNIPEGFKIELERHYTVVPGGAVIVGGGLWKCNTVCTDARGIIENRTYFSQLPAQINGRKWAMVGVGIGLFGNNNNSGGVFYFNHY